MSDTAIPYDPPRPPRVIRLLSRVAWDLTVSFLSPDQVWVRYHQRGAFDPAYASPVARDLTVQDLAGPGEKRHAAVAGFLRGWVEGHPDPEVPVLAWHRLLGDTAVEVSRG